MSEAIYIKFSDCGEHIRKWSRKPFEGSVRFVPASGLVIAAKNLRRYPFESATMAEAAQLAANQIDSVADPERNRSAL